MLTFTWLASAIIAPALMARRALRLGHQALNRRQFSTARRHLQRAARHEPLREQAICLAAEADLLDRRPSEALYALNTLLLEQDQSEGGGKPRSPRVRLLRGLAGCMVGRAAAARRELAAIQRSDASVDELLAAAQACILCNDAAGAQQLLDQLAPQPLAGPLAARAQLCRAALYFRLNAWEKCLAALPPNDQCSPRDALTCSRVRVLIQQKLAEESIPKAFHMLAQ